MSEVRTLNKSFPVFSPDPLLGKKCLAFRKTLALGGKKGEGGLVGAGLREGTHPAFII